MPSQSEGRAKRTICPATAKLEQCSRVGCRNSHSFVESALLEHTVHAQRAKYPLWDSTITAEYVNESRAAPWTVRLSAALPDGSAALAQKEGPSLVSALRFLLLDDPRSVDGPVKACKGRSRTLCHAVMNGRTCTAGGACHLSHTLLDPSMVVDFAERHTYPGRAFIMSYMDGADGVLNGKWQVAITVSGIGRDALRPWREVSVVHANLNVALQLLKLNVSETSADLERPITRHTIGSVPLASRTTRHPDPPPAYSLSDDTTVSDPHAATAREPRAPMERADTSSYSTGDHGTPPAYADFMGKRTDIVDDGSEMDPPLIVEPNPVQPQARPSGMRVSSSSHPPPQLTFQSASAHPYYNRDLYDRRPGEFPWTAWETLYWTQRCRPPRSRYTRLNTTYNLGLPTAPPVQNPDGLDMLDEMDSVEILGGLWRAAVLAAQQLFQRFMAWRARAPANMDDFNAAVYQALQLVDRRLPNHHLSADLVHLQHDGLGTWLRGIGIPMALWLADRWLFGGAFSSSLKVLSWPFLCYVYPPTLLCALVATLTHSRLLTSAILCVLHPAAVHYVFLDWLTGGWIFSLFVSGAQVTIGTFVYYVVLRMLGHPVYMAVLMRGLSGQLH